MKILSRFICNNLTKVKEENDLDQYDIDMTNMIICIEDGKYYAFEPEGKLNLRTINCTIGEFIKVGKQYQITIDELP